MAVEVLETDLVPNRWSNRESYFSRSGNDCDISSSRRSSGMRKRGLWLISQAEPHSIP